MTNLKFILPMLALLGMITAGRAEPSQEEPSATDPLQPREDPAEVGIFLFRDDQNLLLNPDFNQKTNYWVLVKEHGAKAKIRIAERSDTRSDNTAEILIEKATSERANIQLIQHLELQALTTYLISFKAEVDSAKEIDLSFGNEYVMHWKKSIVLEPGKELYGPYAFNSYISDPSATVSFALGDSHIGMLIDSVAVYADHTPREFQRIMTNSGVNIYGDKGKKMICIDFPFDFPEDVPVAVLDETGRLLLTHLIESGKRSGWIDLNGLKVHPDRLMIDVYLPGRKIRQTIHQEI